MSRIRGTVFSFLGITEGSVIPSVKIARHVGNRLCLPATDSRNFLGEWRGGVLFLVNGAYAFCKILQELGEAILEADRVVWIQNDYTVVPPIDDGYAQSPFRRAFVLRRERGKPRVDYWTTCEKLQSVTSVSSYVNWNALAWSPFAGRVERGEDLLYYGSFRANRRTYFDRYFAYANEIPITVSSPGRGDEPNAKFAEGYPHCRHIGKITGMLEAELARHGAGLYVEDRQSHREYHSPANRFYEMLGAGLPIMFQPECAGTFRRAGVTLREEWLCSSRASAKNFMRLRDKHGAAQREELARDFHLDLEKQISEAISKLASAK